MKAALTRDFARHYVEMVVVMLVGMGLFALPARWATDALWPAVAMLLAMFLAMILRPQEYSHARGETTRDARETRWRAHIR